MSHDEFYWIEVGYVLSRSSFVYKMEEVMPVFENI